MRTASYLLLASIAAFLGATARAQAEMQHVVVDSMMRPGSNFASVQEGIAAVVPGGTVEVRASSLGYRDVRPIAVDKPIKIVGVASSLFPRPLIADPILVSGIATGHQATLRGLWVPSSVVPFVEGLVIENCSGTVWVDDCRVGGAALPTFDARIENAANVHLRECVIYSGSEPYLIRDSSVVVEQSTLLPGSGVSGIFFASRAAITVGSGADVTLIRSEVFGAAGWLGNGVFQQPLETAGGTLRVDAASKLVGSVWGPVTTIVPGTSSEVWIDPNALIVSGQVVVHPQQPVIWQPVRVVVAATPYQGQRYTAELRGAHGPDLFGAIVLSHGVPSPFPSLHPSIGQGTEPDYTTAWMNPATAQVVYLGPPNGRVTLSAEYLPLHATMVLQGALFGADNVIRLTPPLTQVVLSPDTAW